MPQMWRKRAENDSSINLQRGRRTNCLPPRPLSPQCAQSSTIESRLRELGLEVGFLLGRIACGFLFSKPKLQRRSLPVAKCENGHKFRGIQYNPSLFFPMIEVVGVAMKYGRPSSNDILIWTICHWRREVTSYMMTIIKPD